MHKLFTYGTLTIPAQMSRVIGREIDGKFHSAKDVRTKQLSHNPIYLQMVHEEGYEVYGVIYEITSEEFERVDRYETSMYKRDHMIVDGEVIWFYTEREIE